MIEEVRGDILKADTEALVNTVNTVGVMGKGVALQFKLAYPENFRAYEAACRREEVKLGQMFVFRRNALHGPRLIINFPTKGHWLRKSRIGDIESGLQALVQVIHQERITSIAIPPLGCGSGGLKWDEVKKRIMVNLHDLPNVRVLLYSPDGAPAAEKMRISTEKPNMTPGRAAILGLMHRYGLPGYRLTILEIQKLAYFLQAAGEPLKLNFVKQKYGPYAETLHHVLQRMEGHFIRGYGDRTRKASLELFPDAIDEAERFLEVELATRERLELVSRLIDGFETPYGMELLATVHWVATQEDYRAKSDPQIATRLVLNWNQHKRRTFVKEHILIAWNRLHDEGWFDSSGDARSEIIISRMVS